MYTAAASTREDLLNQIAIGTCLRCQGLRIMRENAHICGGVCFQCKGDGFYLYLGRALRFSADAEMPRAARLEIIRQALAAFAWFPQDEYLNRKPKASRVWLSLLIQRFASTLDVVAYDRAMLALHKHSPRKWEAVEAKRAELFPGAAPMVRPAAAAAA